MVPSGLDRYGSRRTLVSRAVDPAAFTSTRLAWDHFLGKPSVHLGPCKLPLPGLPVAGAASSRLFAVLFASSSGHLCLQSMDWPSGPCLSLI